MRESHLAYQPDRQQAQKGCSTRSHANHTGAMGALPNLHLLCRDGSLLHVSGIFISSLCSAKRNPEENELLSHGLDALLTGNRAKKDSAFVPSQATFWRVCTFQCVIPRGKDPVRIGLCGSIQKVC